MTDKHKPTAPEEGISSEAWPANVKRTYDAYQHHHLESIGRDRQHFDAIQTAEREHCAQLKQLSLQAMQNAIETANGVGKQGSRHSDLAIDRQWNVDEQSWIVSRMFESEFFKDSLKATVSAAVAEALAGQE